MGRPFFDDPFPGQRFQDGVHCLLRQHQLLADQPLVTGLLIRVHCVDHNQGIDRDALPLGPFFVQGVAAEPEIIVGSERVLNTILQILPPCF